MNTKVLGVADERHDGAGAEATPNPREHSGNAVLPPFDPVRPNPVKPFIARLIMSPPQRVLRVFRALWPIIRVGSRAFVLRYDDVAEVLARSDVFKVPFDTEIARLNDGDAKDGTPFILGIDDRAAHGRQLQFVMQAFKRDDIEAIVKPAARASAKEILEAAGGRIDAIQELITAVPLDICAKYYGVEVAKDERRTFALAAITLSSHLFGLPPIEPSKSGIENAAGAYVRAVVDRAIARQRGAPPGAPADKTVLARLQKLHRENPGEFTEKHIRAVLIGMIVGFVPTNTMAGGHIIEALLRKPDFMRQAQAAASAGDDERLEHCLFEALRFMPLNLGPFRVCRKDHVVAADTPRAKTIRKDTIVLPLTSSAMFDVRQVSDPFTFEPARPASNYMHFGFGMHWCAGVFIARAQITQTFKALLDHRKVERADGAAGDLKLWALFPDQLHVNFRSA